MSFTYDERSRLILNREIDRVELSTDKTGLIIHFRDGGRAVFQTVSDCCSKTWIEHIEIPEPICCAKIYNASDSGQIQETLSEYECIRVYQTTFKTSKGDLTVEYRNSSNGYYGGTLELIEVT